MYPGLIDIVICVILTLCFVILYLRITDNDNEEKSPYDKN
jgi:hypothetical protein